MKKTVFEKFQAKSLGKEETKSIVGGDYAQCISECMADSFPLCEYGSYYPCCACQCGNTYPLDYCDPIYNFGGTMEFPCCNHW